MKQWFFSALLALTITPSVAGQQPLGLWLAGSDGAPLRSVVELIVEGDRMFGRIERVIDRDGAEVSVTCDDRCPEKMRGEPMKGLVFITGLRRSQDRWIGGRVINLEPGFLRGVEADCEITFKGESVEFFGYKGIRSFGSRVTWPKYK